MRAAVVADALWGAALALSAAAVALLAWPARAPVRDVPPPSLAARATVGTPPLADVTVTHDVFAAGHTPPRARWTPPEPDTLPPGLAPDPVAAAALSTLGGAGAADAYERPRFYGTVIDAVSAGALLRFPGTPAAQLYRVGARERGWRVLAVTPERVRLAAPSGEALTLRLAPPRDSEPTAPRDSVPPANP